MSDVLTFRPAKITLISLRVFPLIYMGTPYTRYPAGLQVAFEQSAKLAGRLIRNGVRVYSPIAHCHPIAIYGDLNPIDHSIWIPLNESMMRASNALLVAEMEGWKDSIGVQQEIGIFERDGKPVYYINPNSLDIRQ